MKISTIGIDLAKNVFAIHGVDENGNTLAGAADAAPQPDVAVFREARAVSDRNGSVRKFTFLGTQADRARA